MPERPTEPHRLPVRVVVNVVCPLGDELSVNGWRKARLGFDRATSQRLRDGVNRRAPEDKLDEDAYND